MSDSDKDSPENRDVAEKSFTDPNFPSVGNIEAKKMRTLQQNLAKVVAKRCAGLPKLFFKSHEFSKRKPAVLIEKLVCYHDHES